MAPLSSKLDWALMNPVLASTLNPMIANPANYSSMLSNIQLKVGTNIINHKLGRIMQGWIICDQNAAASIYRSAPMNNKTLTLTSSAVVTINLEVF